MIVSPKGRGEEDQGGEALPPHRVRARRRHAKLCPRHRGGWVNPRKNSNICFSYHSSSFFIEGHRGGQRGGRLHHGEAGQGRHAREVDGQEDRLPDPHVQRLRHLQRGMIQYYS